MTDISVVVIAISAFFYLFVALRALTNLKVCALCGAVSATWIGLLVLRFLGGEIDPLILGILMGGSAVGLMYMLEGRLPEMYHLFRLPFIVTLLSLIYLTLSSSTGGSVYVILALLWGGFALLFAVRSSAHWKGSVQKVIECCKNW